MADKKYFPKSLVPIRKTEELLPTTFRTPANKKFMEGVVDPLFQPGVLDKTVGYIGRRYGKTYNGVDTYLDNDETLRSRYQLEPGIIFKNNNKITDFYDYLDFKNILKFFNNPIERDDKITSQDHYTWNPPIEWDKFVNFREYYWVPSGPPAVEVAGEFDNIESTYTVTLGVGSESTYIFTPDGMTNNPTITLYRGQTYKFEVNCPDEGFSIRRNYDTGSLIYDYNFPYSKGQLVVQENKLYEAINDVLADPGHVITDDDPNWTEVGLVSANNQVLNYNDGIINNGTEFGTVEFTVPYNAPDVLFYQGLIDPNRIGRFIIDSVISNTKIDVENEIIGKQTYLSSNGVVFTNGLIVSFTGKVTPEQYAEGEWLVEGVGDAITLIRFDKLLPLPIVSSVTHEVLFDNEGFDTDPFADARYIPTDKDYITIARHSRDSNAWSRYNRWFHKSVLNYAYEFRGQTYSAPEDARAKRPIIEFKPNIQLFNYGNKAKQIVDYIDDYTDDVFSKIEGQSNYNVDGEFLFDGARILVTADTDRLANNRIYVVKKITHLNKEQITLIDADDSTPVLGECVIIRRGVKNEGKMFHFDGTNWVPSQEKTSVNQQPMFDVFDTNGVSFSDADTYPVSSFKGIPLVAYSIGNGVNDTELGFSLDYHHIENTGDVLFKWVWDTEEFTYISNRSSKTLKLSTGFYKNYVNNEYLNGWADFDKTYAQPIVDTVLINNEEGTNTVTINAVNWKTIDWDNTKIIFYRNGKKLSTSYEFNGTSFVFEDSFDVNDVITVKVIGDVVATLGYHEIPLGLEKNPLNKDLVEFTYGQAVDHLQSALEFSTKLIGIVPGNTNLRDINGYQTAAKRFLKHSGSAPLALSLLCDKETNIIKAIRYAKKSYSDFKSNFLERARAIPYNDNIVDFVDDILSSLTKTKTADSPWSDSDMVGSGAYTSLDYTVSDEGITTFALSTNFSLEKLSRNAVYVYLNGKQLLYGRDYEFNATFGFVNILAELAEDDKIQIREYVSTAVNHIPPTPTSMGMYKKYTPMIFVDDTYNEPHTVIQGHDGSITITYGDYRDELLLELEYRIYNNIKQEYNEELFDIDEVLGGYYRTSLFTKSEFDEIISSEYLKWVQKTRYDYTTNQYFRDTEPFTYTYSNMMDPTKTQYLPGYWRGVYMWAYDTDRPHRCPWEMLGFSQKPGWWDEQYGEAPYTSNNLILWEDIENGIIRQGNRAGIYDQYKRPGILKHLPVDGDGNLLNPLDSGFATNFTLINNKGSFKPGDVSPAEYAWRSSSEWPFTVAMALCLLKPFEFITSNFDRSKSTVNVIGQTVNVLTNTFVKPEDIIVPDIDGDQSEGLIQYITGYVKAKGSTEDILRNRLLSIDVNLSSRLSGFVDKAEQKYLLDSKNPSSTTNSVFIPAENFDIIFNVSAPIKTVTYSGVVIEKTNAGWSVSGYDTTSPYFNYYDYSPVSKDTLITVGGVSATFVNWDSDKVFTNGQICRYNEVYYRCIESHRSEYVFKSGYWQKLPKLPIEGGVSAIRRSKFNKFKVKRFLYGTVLNEIQDVVDLILGYQEYLFDQGFVFDRYDYENQVSQDWITSCKEFMFWTSHNWADGSLITLSPGALRIKIEQYVGVADNILDGFYEYQIFGAEGSPLPIKNIDVSRDFRTTTIEAVDTTDGIYFLKLFYVLKEHVVVFDDRTVFNDVIYDEATGYRQERLKARGFRTTDWDGDYTSPGFLFDNVSIAAWEPFKDYKLGDIVAYKSFYWTSQENQFGQSTFDNSKWEKTDSELRKQLVANFDYKVKQIEDYYNVTAEGLGSQPRSLARHAVGYQQRQYLQDLAEDPTTQFLLYQGFVREKGTNNAIVKLFDKLGSNSDSTVKLNEEWTFRVGQFGGVSQLAEIEFNLSSDAFKLNPQPISLLENLPPGEVYHQYHVVELDDFTINSDNITTEFTPVKIDEVLRRSAGYVNAEYIDYIIKTRDELINIDVETFTGDDYIWVVFDEKDVAHRWAIIRYSYVVLDFINAKVDGEDITFYTFQLHSFNKDDLIGIKGIEDVTGIFKVNRVTPKTITITVPGFKEKELTYEPYNVVVGKFYESRIHDINEYSLETAATLPTNSKLWIDKNKNGLWEVIQKQNVYKSSFIKDNFGSSVKKLTGAAVLYNEHGNHVIATLPYPGITVTYIENKGVLESKQALESPVGFEQELANDYGKELAISPDGKWLAVGCSKVSYIQNHYLGELDSITPNFNKIDEDQIVSYGGVLYKTNKVWNDLSEAQQDLEYFIANGVSLEINEDSTSNIYWEESTSNSATHQYTGTEQGSIAGVERQGAVILYSWNRTQWKYHDMIVSPIPKERAYFGQSIVISFNGDTEYYMNISSHGENKVYQYTYKNNMWQHESNDYYIEDDSFAPDDKFGWSITSSTTGDVLVVGSLTGSKAVVYNRVDGKYENLYELVMPDNNENSQFGYCTKLSKDGNTLVITAPLYDEEQYNIGRAYLYKYNGEVFELKQTLESFAENPDENFGVSVDISTDTIVIGARNTIYVAAETFGGNISFDQGRTTFYNDSGYLGAVYVFENLSDDFILTEKLESDNFVKEESFGHSVSCVGNKIVVGSPTFTQLDAYGDKIVSGNVRLFKKDASISSWRTLDVQTPTSDLTKIKSIVLYDNDNNKLLGELDYVDHAKLKVLNQAEQELTFKTVYDPAIYNVGTSAQTVSTSQQWLGTNVGKLWWDLSTVKWPNYNQGDFSYKVGNWNNQSPFSSVDVYEWIETTLLPSEWSELADTNEGLAENISGTPKYDDTVYSKKEIYNPVTGKLQKTLYYYWVKNTVVVPAGMPNRRISAFDVAQMINNPIGTGLPYVGFIESNKLLLFNLDQFLSTSSIAINIQYIKNTREKLNPIHNEYLLLTEGLKNSVPNEKLEEKWIDSLVGTNASGARVPDLHLSEKLKYGLSFRPIQSMFVNRLPILQTVIEHINTVLDSEPFSDTISFEYLNLYDAEPSSVFNLYDVAVDTILDLDEVGTTRVRNAKLQVNIVNGEVDTIDIINPGFGYRTPPTVIIDGDGTDAEAEVTIDRTGKVDSVVITNKGKRYSSATANVRNFSVLVRVDETVNNFWCIYAWDDERKIFFRRKTQGYDTRRYWDYKDWWKVGYGIKSRIVKEIQSIVSVPTIEVEIDDLIRVKEFSSGGWAVFKKIADADLFSDAYEIVGRENGTIKLLETLYDDHIGYDVIDPYDIEKYDYSRANELRNILKAVKNNIFIGDYEVEWNTIFFKSVKYAFVEQPYIDWAFKTSFLTAVHNVGDLDQPVTYKLENLESFNEYINEVKPYRTTVREYVENHTGIDYALNTVTDFDLPAVYSDIDEKIIPITKDDIQINEFPWRWWRDNNGYSVDRIEVTDGGEDYLQPPTVLIEGDGEGAVAKAYITNGQVSYIRVLEEGSNYTTPPTISLVGGNLPGSKEAVVSAILGKAKVRTINVGMKFDRISKDGDISNFTQVDTFIAPGYSSSFELKYVPTSDKSKVNITIDGQIVFLSEYNINVYAVKSGTAATLYGRIVFNNTPAEGSEIIITYEKNDRYLDAVNRINKYYSPTSGMKGRAPTQLMTGIDFGGTSVQGTTFDVTGGWDALPWYTDTWDSVESSADYYVRVNGVIDSVTLPTVPANGQVINVYYAKNPYAKLAIDFDTAVLSNGGIMNVETYGVFGHNECTINIPVVTSYDTIEENNNVAKAFIMTELVKSPCISLATFDDNVLTILGAFTGSDKMIHVISITGLTDINSQPVDVEGAQAFGEDEVQPIRIDDEAWGLDESSTIINSDAVMPTFIGDGSTREIEIGQYITVELGDTLVFRNEESDGTVIIKDTNIVDTDLGGGSLNTTNSYTVTVAPNTVDGTYSTATGLTAEEIVILGGEFVQPAHVPAPEENVPGQVLDNLSIRVFNSTFGGAAPLQIKTQLGDDVTKIYDIDIDVMETTSITVYVDKIKRELGSTLLDYSIDFINKTIEFVTPPAFGEIVEIIAIGIGGINVLDYQDFIADGETSLFLTAADYINEDAVTETKASPGSMFVTVDGVPVEILRSPLEGEDGSFLNSSEFVDIDTKDKALVRFNYNPPAGADIKIISFGDSDNDLSNLVRINKKTVIYNGSNLAIELDKFVNVENAHAASSVIVEVNNKALRGVDSIYKIYDGTNNVIEMPIGTLSSNITIYVDDHLLTFIQDYYFNGVTREVTIDTNNLSIGSSIQVVNDQYAEYRVDNNLVVIDNLPDLVPGDIFNITWFSRYEAMDIISDEYQGGAAEYKLLKQPLGLGYVWVYLNGQRLTVNFDYSISIPTSILKLSVDTTADDIIKIIVFGTEVYRPTSAFEIHKDILNNFTFNSYSITDVELAEELFYYEDYIKVTDASTLQEPQKYKNIPGTVMIDGERIEYMVKEGNVLSQLRRGVAGTSTKEEYAVGTKVINLGRNTNLPYNDVEQRALFNSNSFINVFSANGVDTEYHLTFDVLYDESLHVYVNDKLTTEYNVVGNVLVFDVAPVDGTIIKATSLLIGPLNFTPVKTTRAWVREETSTIPDTYGPCDVVEVFVAGQRLRKDPRWQYTEELGANSPAADKYIDAEFSTNGSDNYIRLTHELVADITIEIVRRIGEVWYDKEDTLLNNTTMIAQAIAQKTSLIPE